MASNDAAKAAEEINTFLAAKVGAVVATSSAPNAVSHRIQKVIWSGGFVGTIVRPPASLLLDAPQYVTGKALNDAAIAHVTGKIGGKANLVLLTQDTMQFLPRPFAAIRNGSSALPGVTIVADIAPNTVTNKGGSDTINTILLANFDIDVVLGGDAVVLGVLQAAEKDPACTVSWRN